MSKYDACNLLYHLEHGSRIFTEEGQAPGARASRPRMWFPSAQSVGSFLCFLQAETC